MYTWIRIALANLLVVAILGILLRYKILFPLPFINQKHVLHAHSHFAFTGWVTQILMILIVWFINSKRNFNLFKKYNLPLALNLICSWGMLITFLIQGYGFYSIVFSTASILVSYWFAIIVWKDINTIQESDIGNSWIKVALLSNILSSIGAFTLAFLMANKLANQNLYMSAQYFFLHFQYNGWFFFCCMGFICSSLFKNIISKKVLNKVFNAFLFSLVPTFFLSILWMHLPGWLYIIIVIAAFIQVIAWFYLLFHIKKNIKAFKSNVPKKIISKLYSFVAVAITIKLLLQLGSIHPTLSKLAFGFRPIVIGYLHLVLLAIISLSIIIYILSLSIFNINVWLKQGVILFASSIILNELLLMIQGVAALDYIIVPFINELLLLAAVFLFMSILLVNYGINKNKVIEVIK